MQEKKAKKEIRKIGDVTIERAALAGFCFGVDRAVAMTEKLLKEKGKAVTLGPLIHNPSVVKDLERRGAVTVEKAEDVPRDTVAVIRSHGVGKHVYDSLKASGVEICDGTCPFVSKIHDIAREVGKEDKLLLIAGDENHPEIQGIVGHATGPVLVFENLTDLRNKLDGIDVEKPMAVISQTTFQTTKWLECTKFLKKRCTSCDIFDTICSVTWAKQQETEDLARRSDIVIVMGGRGSSNTKKLQSVAAAYTKAVQIETAEELSADMLLGARYIGLTAGASTPSSAIEEVLTTMSDVIREEAKTEEVTQSQALIQEEEMTFEQMLDESMKPVYAGMIVKGVVESVSANEVTVDIGTKQTGIIKLEELTDDPVIKSADEVVKRDDEVELVVVKVNDQDGIIYLSRRQMEARKGAEEVSKAAEEGTIMDGYVVESNKGGLVANVKGVKVFIPASQATARRGEDYTALVRKHVKLKIKEFSPRRTIGSIREVLAEEQREARQAFWGTVEEGKQYVGTVKSLTSYGAFVDIGGVDGLVHISELSWSRIKHPSEVVNVGDSIEVYVKEVDSENKKVSLGFKKQQDNPWEKLKAEYPVGSVFKAPVVSLTQFGAFVRILPGIDGLVHISEISHDRVEKVADVLAVDDVVEVKMLDMDFDRNRISLSMKALLPEPEKAPEQSEEVVVASASAEETVVAPEIEAEQTETE